MSEKSNRMNIPFSPPDITESEIKEVVDALRSGWITTGPKTKQFEKELAQFSNTETMVCFNSATAALEMTLRLLGIKTGDEVIVPAYTYTASCSPICHVGATPVMVDVAKDSFEMDYEQLEAAITERTKAIIPVDLAGILCDYDRLFNIVNRKAHLFRANNEIQEAFHRVILLSDCAHGFGACRYGKKTGSIADFTVFSFHAVKNLTTAEGGAVTWKRISGIENEQIYHQYQLLSLHGQTKDALNKNKLGCWEYDIMMPAYKCNMTDIQAALGLAQLSRYKDMMTRRHKIIQMYDERLRTHFISTLNHKNEFHQSSGHLYLTRIHGIDEKQRNRIIQQMAEKGISCNVHYKPLPMLTAYKDMGFHIEDFPNAYDLYRNEITLPLYSTLSDEQVSYILKQFLTILEEYRC